MLEIAEMATSLLLSETVRGDRCTVKGPGWCIRTEYYENMDVNMSAQRQLVL